MEKLNVNQSNSQNPILNRTVFVIPVQIIMQNNSFSILLINFCDQCLLSQHAAVYHKNRMLITYIFKVKQNSSNLPNKLNKINWYEPYNK